MSTFGIVQTGALPPYLAGADDRNWYAVHARAQQERRVTDQLQSRDVEVFYPSYFTKRRWKNGQEPTLEMPLLPGYLFVRIVADDRLRVLEAPGVVKIVGNGRMLLPVSSDEIERMQTGCQLGQLQPHPLLTVGKKARVRSGAFAGVTGIVVEQRGLLRMVITIECAMRSVSLQVDANELEPV